MSSNPTLINLPPPPSDPITPSEVPSRSGTPNSTTTSMSELSTVAIKDGHRGLGPHHHHQASGLSSQLDAERADRISRLAGLERVTTARNPQTPTSLNPGGASFNSPATAPPPMSYFDASGNPALARERSTVGSASATGSVGARTTWAGSEAGDTSNFDKMSESQDLDMERDTSSVGGGDYMSEDGDVGGPGSLVAFGEGARTPARGSVMGMREVMGSPSGKVTTPRGGGQGDVRMGEDGDTSSVGAGSFGGGGGFGAGGGAPQGHAAQQAERIVRENMNTTSQDRMTSHNEVSPKRGQQGEPQLGQFGFEK